MLNLVKSTVLKSVTINAKFNLIKRKFFMSRQVATTRHHRGVNVRSSNRGDGLWKRDGVGRLTATDCSRRGGSIRGDDLQPGPEKVAVQGA